MASWRDSLRSLEESLGLAERAVVDEAVDLDLALAAMLRAHQSLIESEERYHLFIEHSSDGIARYDMDGPIDVSAPVEEQLAASYRHSHCRWCNLAMARMLGFQRVDELIGRPLREVMPPDVPECADYLRRFLSSHYRSVEESTVDVGMDGRRIRTQHSAIGRVENGHLISTWVKAKRIVEPDVKPDAPTIATDELTRLALLASDVRVPPDLAEELKQLCRTLDRLSHRTE